MNKLVSFFWVLVVVGISIFPSVSSAKPNCYSAKYCGGKILNHKDRHNCKNSGGKSWNDGIGRECITPP